MNPAEGNFCGVPFSRFDSDGAGTDPPRMKIIFVLIGLLLGFSIGDDLKAVTRIPVEIPASKLTVG